MRPGEVFTSVVKGRNLMTPTVDGYHRGELSGGTPYVAELSSGRGIADEPIFGVTFVLYDGDAWRRDDLDLSGVYWSESDARDQASRPIPQSQRGEL